MAVEEGQGRREALGLAVLRLLATRGMDAISYGAVASEAGVSKGLVQHYFPERLQLIDCASQVLAQRMAARLAGAFAGRRAEASESELFRVLAGMLPVDDEARMDAAAGRALFCLALSDAEANARYRQGRRAALDLIRSLVAKQRPGVSPAVAEQVARDLLGTAAQLGEDLLLGELTPRKARALLRHRCSFVS
ncbi:MAG: TetR/AcrR family transcriptional regulator [Myxococcaceae bacterium]